MKICLSALISIFAISLSCTAVAAQSTPSLSSQTVKLIPVTDHEMTDETTTGQHDSQQQNDNDEHMNSDSQQGEGHDNHNESSSTDSQPDEGQDNNNSSSNTDNEYQMDDGGY